MTRTIISNSEDETIKAGFEFAGSLRSNDIVGLDGELGTGKTQFVKGICNYFRVTETVNSPTFIIVNEYNGKSDSGDKKIKIFHFDLYRLGSPSDLEVIGFDEYLNCPQSVTLIEWPLLAEAYLGKIIRKVTFDYGDNENSRIIKL